MLDQYYTNNELAHELVAEVSSRWEGDNVLFIEPSAGTGAFINPLIKLGRDFRAMDIDPKHEKVVYGDFLYDQHNMFHGNHSKIVVIGNPPFGKNSSVAVKFFNKAADYADEIAFIVPRTFRKASIQNRLNRFFHLTEDRTIADNAFIFNGVSYDVPCTWQIWTRQSNIRPLIEAPKIDHLLTFLPSSEGAEFAMRRVGFYAGRIIVDDMHRLSKTTHYFLKEKTQGVKDSLSNVNWPEITAQTAGARSLSKMELAFKVMENRND